MSRENNGIVSSSDNDSSDTQDEPDNNSLLFNNREKRYVHHTRTVIQKDSWCDTNTHQPPLSPSGFDPPAPPLRRVIWPPPSNSSAGASTSAALPFSVHNVHNTYGRRPVYGGYYGNPLFGSKMQLYSKTGFFLAVYPDGRVTGTRDDNDLHTHLEITKGDNIAGHVRIRGMLTNMYVAMDNRGRLYAESNPTDEATIFIETFIGLYNCYLSRKWSAWGWYIGIKKSGKFKRGPTTAYGQKATKFLPRRTKFE